MNYLAHALLASGHPQELLGSIYADFVRGTLNGLAINYPPLVLKGIGLHRKIDHFTDQHPLNLQGRRLFSPQRRRYSGIVLDVLYDHYLHRHWDIFSDQPKQQFIKHIYDVLEQNAHTHPARLAQIAPHMVADDWLGSYADLEVIGFALDRISGRLKRENSLRGSLEEIRQHYSALERLFLHFFPLAIEYAEGLHYDYVSG
ncbi:MAG: DUF479 domain-containing protein [Gammaproteobacteria bacterium]|nr:DUF479 domain-containing protein [Gammaproteobacteria bacterium]